MDRLDLVLGMLLSLIIPCIGLGAIRIIDSNYQTASLCCSTVKAFPLNVDAEGNIYTVTGTSSTDSFVKIAPDGRATTLVQHVNHVVGVMAGLQKGFDGKFYANAGANPSPTPHGVVAFDAVNHVARTFSADPNGYADGGLAFDSHRQRLYEINDSVDDLVAIDSVGHRNVLFTGLAKHCVGLALEPSGSVLALERIGGTLLRFDPESNSAKCIAVLGVVLPGQAFGAIAVNPKDSSIWFISRGNEECTLYQIINDLPHAVAASDNLVGLTIGPPLNSNTDFCVYVSNPTHNEIFCLKAKSNTSRKTPAANLAQYANTTIGKDQAKNKSATTSPTPPTASELRLIASAAVNNAKKVRDRCLLKFQQTNEYKRLDVAVRAAEFAKQNASPENSVRCANELLDSRKALSDARILAVADDRAVVDADAVADAATLQAKISQQREADEALIRLQQERLVQQQQEQEQNRKLAFEAQKVRENIQAKEPASDELQTWQCWVSLKKDINGNGHAYRDYVQARSDVEASAMFHKKHPDENVAQIEEKQ